jgi:hypothetical protein
MARGGRNRWGDGDDGAVVHGGVTERGIEKKGRRRGWRRLKGGEEMELGFGEG